jgi:hypothetical protein
VSDLRAGLPGDGLAKAGVDIGRGRPAESGGCAGRGADRVGLVEVVGSCEVVAGVGLECAVCWGGAGGEGLRVELGSGVVADETAGLVLESGQHCLGPIVWLRKHHLHPESEQAPHVEREH